MIKKILIITVITLTFPTLLWAADFIGVGAQVGFQYDVGNLESRPGIETEAQSNILLGAFVKIDRGPLFMRTGADHTFSLGAGKVLNSSAGKLSKTNIQYTSIPLYLGVNFPVRDKGKFYIGMGGTYLLGRGNVTTSAGVTTISDWAYGPGFLAGIQLRVGDSIRFFMEWEYLSAKTDPVVNIDTGSTWKDFSVDFTGHRIHLGMLYYII
ncbi:MAG: outer membrane beta-barrel protein [bacterium]|nr:outer membrane beta-barrel protein [bacterium]